MADNTDPDFPRHRDSDRDRGAEPGQPAGRARYRDHGPDASAAVGGGPSEDIRHLSQREERDLHFNGYPSYHMEPLHELCTPGGCRYKTDAENSADLEAWYRCGEPALDDTDLEAVEDDPEAGL